MSTPAPTHFGPYQVRRKLADGGMGQLFLARREMADGLGMECVIKTIRPNYAPDPRYLDLFLQEARITARLRHQNIVQIFDYGRDEDGNAYLAMEYVAGHNLQELFGRAATSGRRLTPVEALRLVVEILKGLEHAHTRCDENGKPLGIVHRDLTPNNILISNAGEVKIADFGIAMETAGAVAERQDLRGKFHYMSPEQVTGQAIDARADLFLVGIVLYEALTGVKPFDADSVRTLLGRITRGEYREATELVELPERLGGFLRRTLQRDVALRFQSAQEMLAAAERILLAIGPGTSTAIRDVYHRLFGDQTILDDDESESLPTQTILHERTAARSPRRRLAALATIGSIAVLAMIIWLWPRAPQVETQSVSPIVPAMETLNASPEPMAESTPAPTPMQNAPTPAPPSIAADKPTPAKIPAPIGEPGKVVIGDLMPFAKIYIDGKYYDDTPTAPIPLAPGLHEIKLVNPNFEKTATFKVNIESGKDHPIYSWP